MVISAACLSCHFPSPGLHAISPGSSGKPPYPSAWDKSFATLILPLLEDCHRMVCLKQNYSHSSCLAFSEGPHHQLCNPKWKHSSSLFCCRPSLPPACPPGPRVILVDFISHSTHPGLLISPHLGLQGPPPAHAPGKVLSVSIREARLL